MTDPEEKPIAVFWAAGRRTDRNADSAEPGCERLQPYECGTIRRMLAADDVYLASQPQPGDLVRAREGGVRCVVNLRLGSELPWDEGDLVEQLGMRYFHLPFTSKKPLGDRLFDEFRRLLADPANRPMLVHCETAGRAGPLWVAYRVLDQGAPIEEAIDEATAIGMKEPRMAEAAKAYIERRR